MQPPSKLNTPLVMSLLSPQSCNLPTRTCSVASSFDRDARQLLPSSLFNDEEPRFSLSIASSWEDHPDYGLIHRQGCPRCSSYMEHINGASHNKDPMLAILLRMRDDRKDAHIAEGRRLQKESDAEAIDRMNHDLSTRVATLRRYRLERNEARAQLDQTKALLLEAQAENARLKLSLHLLESSSNTTSASSHDSSGDEDGGYVSCASGPPFESPTWSFETSLPNSPSAPEQSFGASARLLDESSPIVGPRSYAAAAAAPTSPPTQTITIPTSVITPSPPTATTVIATPITPTAAVSPTSPTTRKVTWPKKRTDLDWLMKAAHRPGQERILFRVKGLCADAHATPREQKTEMMKYLLANWRNPANLLDSVSAQNNPRLEDPVEDWYRYLKVHPTSWPRGVPKDAEGGPCMPQLRASRAVRRMYPTVNQAEFVAVVVGLFSVAGQYRTLIDERGLVVRSSVAYKPYTPVAEEMSVEEVAAHLASCGVSVTAAMNDFEPWAREYVATTNNSATN